jgi:hypothetical protein
VHFRVQAQVVGAVRCLFIALPFKWQALPFGAVLERSIFWCEGVKYVITNTQTIYENNIIVRAHGKARPNLLIDKMHFPFSC